MKVGGQTPIFPVDKAVELLWTGGEAIHIFEGGKEGLKRRKKGKEEKNGLSTKTIHNGDNVVNNRCKSVDIFL